MEVGYHDPSTLYSTHRKQLYIICWTIYFRNVKASLEFPSVFIVSYIIAKYIREIVSTKGKCYCAVYLTTIELI